MKKWLRSMVFVFVLVLSAMLFPGKEVFADDGWGTWGDNVKWHFYESKGLLQIEGEGAMLDKGQYDERLMPWYSYRKNVKKVVIGKGITHVCNAAFSGYSDLSSVSLPDTVTSIGRLSFYKTGLKKVVLPDKLVSVDYNSFAYCESLQSVVIPGTLKTVAGGSFQGCKNLSSIKINEGVEVLEWGCFKGTGIKVVDIPASVTTISSAFEQCDKLDHITIPKTVTKLTGDLCFGCDLLRYAIVEAQCGIPEGTFGGCSNLVAVKLGEGVTSIDYFSFWDDKKLAVMFVPASVTKINDSAFYGGTQNLTLYGYTDTAAYNYAGMNQFVKFVDVSAQGMSTWEKAWNKAIKENAVSESAKKTMKFTSLSVKKGATKITGKLSVSGATVKVQVGNAKYKKATVKKNTFSIKTPKLKKGTIVRIRVTKNGYKTLSKLVKIK